MKFLQNQDNQPDQHQDDNQSEDPQQSQDQSNSKPLQDVNSLQQELIDLLGKSIIGYTSAPSTNLQIEVDVIPLHSETGETTTPRVLGEMIVTVIDEAGQKVFAIGQIISIATHNQWHSELAFKGVIKQHGPIPHLSGNADIRIAEVTVQSAFMVSDNKPMPHILGTSPTTGKQITVLNDEMMGLIMKDKRQQITYLGKAYGSQVSIPFWFKHFGENDIANGEYGTNDAYHIGVFGKTGSGKTVMSAIMLLGYAKNRNNMSILILDPQSQFYHDKDLLPSGAKFKETVSAGLDESMSGMNYEKYQLTDEVYLDESDIDVIPRLLMATGFLRFAFRGSLGTLEKQELMLGLIGRYIANRSHQRGFLRRVDKKQLLVELIEWMLKPDKSKQDKLNLIYVQKPSKENLRSAIENFLEDINSPSTLTVPPAVEKWLEVLNLYHKNSVRRHSIDDIVKKVVGDKGNCIVLGLASPKTKIQNENLQALFINLIQKRIVEQASEFYEKTDENSNVNTLVVMDEAHRFASQNPSDPYMKSVSQSIVDAVRTTRKYGVGYMFITQSLDSLNNEIIRQMRIFAFGYGLTTGSELRGVKEIINNKAALSLYRSFIDPGSNNQYPFMFFGPASPLSFTGAPVFIQSYKTMRQIQAGLKGKVWNSG